MIEKIEINLLPAEYRIRKRTINIPRSLVYPIVMFVALVCGAWLYTIYLRDREAQLRTDIEVIEKEIAANKHIQDEMTKLREEKRVTEQKIRALMRISVNREKWVRLLEIVSGNLPSYSWLISVKEVDNGERLNLEARTYSFPEVAYYMTKLEQSEYITKVALNGIEQMQGQGRMMYRFTLVCDLNTNVGLGAIPDDETPASADATQQGGRQQRRRGGN